MKLSTSLVLVVFVAGALGCGGGGGGGGGKKKVTIVFAEDFSGGLGLWTTCPTGSGTAGSGVGGNPGPSLELVGCDLSGWDSEATTNNTFDVSDGLTIEWQVETRGYTTLCRGGLSANTGCNGIPADSIAAGFNLTNGATFWPITATFLLNGTSAGTIDLTSALGLPGDPGWITLRVKIRKNGRVSWYANDVHLFTSSQTINVTGTRPVVFQTNSCVAGGHLFDNVLVTTP